MSQVNLLNQLSPEKGSTFSKRRVGRGMGSGVGKTCGRGHKGQKSRSGGQVSIGFEGGQMPLHRRLPKQGFSSRKSIFSAQIRLSELNNLSEKEINIDVLKQAGLVNKHVLFAKVFLSGEITRSITLTGIKASAGSKAAIEKAGGKVN